MKVQLNPDGKRWDVVKGSEVLGTFDSIKAAMDARFELQQAGKAAPETLYFKQDGTAVTKRPRRAA
jgi:hypothetical protein